jgi:AcrR family transcriptional regulator
MTSERKSKFKPVRTVSTLKRIVDSTRFLLARRGYDALSMRAVAGRSGISVGAIYRHFAAKEALVDYVMEETLREFELRLLRAVSSLPVGSFERIAALGAEYICFALEHEEHFKVLFTRMRPSARRLSEIPGQGGYDVLRRCVVEAIESGCIRDADPDLVAFFLWSRVHGIVMLLWACDFRATLPIPADQLTPLGLFEATREFIFSGLGSVAGE